MGRTDVQEAAGEECSVCTLYGSVQTQDRVARVEALIPEIKGIVELLPRGPSESKPHQESDTAASSNAGRKTRCS